MEWFWSNKENGFQTDQEMLKRKLIEWNAHIFGNIERRHWKNFLEWKAREKFSETESRIGAKSICDHGHWKDNKVWGNFLETEIQVPLGKLVTTLWQELIKI